MFAMVIYYGLTDDKVYETDSGDGIKCIKGYRSLSCDWRDDSRVIGEGVSE